MTMQILGPKYATAYALLNFVTPALTQCTANKRQGSQGWWAVVAKALLSALRKDLETQDSLQENATPLQQSCWRHMRPEVCFLIRKGADNKT